MGSSVLPTDLLSSFAGGPKQPEGPPPEDVQRRAAKRRREHDDTDERMAWSDKVPAPSGWLEKAAALANAVELGHWRDVHNLGRGAQVPRPVRARHPQGQGESLEASLWLRRACSHRVGHHYFHLAATSYWLDY